MYMPQRLWGRQDRGGTGHERARQGGFVSDSVVGERERERPRSGFLVSLTQAQVGGRTDVGSFADVEDRAA